MFKKVILAIKILYYYSNGYMFFLEKLGINKNKYTIYKTRTGMKYKTRNNSTDFAILNETVILKEYLRHGFDKLSNESIVLDFGAQAGDFSTYVSLHFGARVYSFEPEPENFQLIQENIELNKLQDKVTPFNKAITNSNGKLKLRLSGWENKGTHSFHYVEGGDYVEVETQDILDLTKQFKKIDLLKIDIEGGEHEILIKRNKEFFNLAKKLVLEYHCQSHVTNSKGLHDLKSVLTDTLGFEIIATHGTDELGIMYLAKANL